MAKITKVSQRFLDAIRDEVLSNCCLNDIKDVVNSLTFGCGDTYTVDPIDFSMHEESHSYCENEGRSVCESHSYSEYDSESHSYEEPEQSISGIRSVEFFINGCPVEMPLKMPLKQPVGIMPRKLWLEARQAAVIDAINIYIRADKTPLKEWGEELKEINEALAEMKVK
jgi:hypothetical protein